MRAPAVRPPRTAWLFFTGAIVLSFFVHEIGHCAVAWLHGYPAIPTPVKEYILKPVPEAIQYQVALGGIIGSVAALLAAVFWLYRHPTVTASGLLAGAMTAPGFYTLRFILAGRGHDATEFQEAQAALGLSYSGHAADWFFVGLFAMATVFWFVRVRARPTPRLVGRLIVGALAALVVVLLLQSINNAVFDPLFQLNPRQNHALTSGPIASARPHASGTLRVLQLQLSLEPVLLITARFLSLREPNRVGLFCDHRMRGGSSLGLCWIDQRNAGTCHGC